MIGYKLHIIGDIICFRRFAKEDYKVYNKRIRSLTGKPEIDELLLEDAKLYLNNAEYYLKYIDTLREELRAG